VGPGREAVRAKQVTELLIACHIVNRFGLRLAVEQPVAEALVVPLEVVMLGELLDSQP